MTTDGTRRSLLQSENGAVGLCYDALELSTDIEPSDGDQRAEVCPVFPSYRLLICAIGSFCFALGFASQAIVGASLFLMIRPADDVTANVTNNAATSSGSHNDNNNASLEGLASTVDTTTALSTGSEAGGQDPWHFRWSKSQYSWLVSSYFIGYYVMQLPAGWLTARFGGHRLIVASTSILIACNALSVWMPRFGPEAFRVLLVISGMVNACTTPSVLDVVARWCPPNESSRLTALVCSGGSLGNGYTYVVSAITSQIDVIGGWPFNFIIMIATQLTALLLWTMFVTNVPEENKRVRQLEVTYIRDRFLARGTKPKEIRSVSTPWRKILTSRHVYACCASSFGTLWISYCYVSAFPIYLAGVRHMNTTVVSLLSGVPFFVNPFVAFAVSSGVDRLREKNIFSTTALRKAADATGKLCTACLLLVASYLPNHYVALFTALYAIAVIVLMGTQGNVWAVNIAELCPHHVGVVTTVVLLFSLPVSFVVPPLFDAMTPDNSEEGWHMCFITTAGVLVATSAFYMLCSSSREQHWDD